MSEPRPPEQFIALAGLRGVAALVVVQRHGFEMLGGARLPGGYLAVDFFFLLSGFVLAHAYDRRLGVSMSTGDFLRARLIRLYPVYLLGLVLMLAVTALIDPPPVAWFAAGLLFLPNIWVGNFVWFVPAAWSLTAELAVNLPFAALHRRLTDRVLVGVIGVAAIALVILDLAYGSLDAGYCGANWVGGFIRVLFSFPLGVLLYRHRPRLANWAPRWSTWPAMVALFGLLAIPVDDVVRDLPVVMLGFPIVLLFASGARPRPLAAGIATALGDLSYPLYVLHAAMFAAAGLFATHLLAMPPGVVPPYFATILLGGMVVIALLVDQWIDRPLRRWLSAPRPARLQTAAMPRLETARPRGVRLSRQSR